MRFFRAAKNYGVVYRFMLSSFGREWRIWVALMVRTISWVIRTTVQPILLAMVLAQLAQGDFESLPRTVLFFAIVSVVSGVMSPIAAVLGIAGESIAYKGVSLGYFKKLVSLDTGFFVDNMSGKLTSSARQFTDNVIEFSRDWREDYVPVLAGLILPIGVIMWSDPLLGVLVIVLTVVMFWQIATISHKYEPYRARARKVYHRISGFLSDTITNIVAVKSCAQEEHAMAVFEKDVDEEVKVFIDKAVVKQKYSLRKELAAALFFAALLGATVFRYQQGSIDLTIAVLVATYMLTIMQSIYMLPGLVERHDDRVEILSEGLAVLATKSKLEDPRKPIVLKRAKGGVKLEDVRFAYGKQEVIKGLNLTIAARQKLGVVGESGAGKSTLANLILRFVDPISGVVTLDGHDLRDFRQTDLHRNVAYVPQEPLLLHDTVRANLKLAAPKAAEEDLWKALRKAHAADFVKELPDGLDSVVGERGVKLSGGQKQRIVIARSLLQDAPVMVLDEATSALDSESEQIIKDSLKDVLRGKTAIVIAHRLSTLADMDRIIVMKDGKIVEDGTHLSLLRRDGVYAKMWKRQIREC
ncbi:ABC transporter ATP-binding protein/permease [Candidatus Saccharibacteria bacterium]|nr:ABC transporter ATP-binding protein/permease [Candidatus Saccharibacteria bacterium]